MNTKEYISSGIIESYILGLASPEEASILECVMKNNAEVKAAFEEAQKTLEDLATAQAMTPPEDLKFKTWSKIQKEQITEEKTSDVSKMNEKWQTLSGSNMQIIALKGVEKHPESKATVFWDQKTKEVYLNAESLPKAPKGMQYQLWAIADGKPVNAGMYTEEKDSKVALSKIPKAQAFAITLEKENGSEVPTMENMYVMGGT